MAAPGVVLINPIFNSFVYARRAVLSFFKYTDPALEPLCINVDDASPLFDKQNWDAWHEDMPHAHCVFHHFRDNKGLTRSWNWGLSHARHLGAKYVICGNSDILFTPYWYEGLICQLEKGASLVGPVSNAPGRNNRDRQNVRHFYPGFQVNDTPDYLAEVSAHLRAHYADVLRLDQINGFFIMAKTETWWKRPYGPCYVFDPKYPMNWNEDDLQNRWRKQGLRRIGFVPASFIFHYRSVSRGDKHKSSGWSRLDDAYKSV